MENVVKDKEMLSENEARKIFGLIRSKANFQNSLKPFSDFSTGEMAKTLPSYEKQANFTRDKAIMQTRCLTRLL